jgi:hypothetical protein
MASSSSVRKTNYNSVIGDALLYNKTQWKTCTRKLSGLSQYPFHLGQEYPVEKALASRPRHQPPLLAWTCPSSLHLPTAQVQLPSHQRRAPPPALHRPLRLVPLHLPPPLPPLPHLQRQQPPPLYPSQRVDQPFAQPLRQDRFEAS